MSDRPRSAGERRPERLLGLDTKQIVEEAKRSAEIASTFRVYRKEFMFDRRFDSATSAEEHVHQKWDGRLEEDEVQILRELDASIVWTKRWNVESEWKTVELAARHAEELQEADPEQELAIVPRNSRREVVLQNYGILKLTR